LIAAEQFTFLGTGWTIGLAAEAALKMREAAGAWTESYPAMEYRHGPISVTGANRVAWAFGPLPDGLAAQIAATGGRLESALSDSTAANQTTTTGGRSDSGLTDPTASQTASPGERSESALSDPPASQIVSPSGRSESRATDPANQSALRGGHSESGLTDPAARQTASPGERPESALLDPMAELIRVQRLAVAIAEARGLDPDQPRHLTRSVILP
jgi:fructoselysine-6-P-deglycase FrlB-like protein